MATRAAISAIRFWAVLFCLTDRLRHVHMINNETKYRITI